jgi:hypothetical protein
LVAETSRRVAEDAENMDTDMGSFGLLVVSGCDARCEGVVWVLAAITRVEMGGSGLVMMGFRL